MTTQSKEFYVEVGDTVSFQRTVSESDVYLFAGITGDLSPNHVNEAAMRRSKFGRRIAHGALLVGFMSTASTMAAERAAGVRDTETPVSLGYDRIRFLKPVYLGETITVTYTVAQIDPKKRRAVSDVVVANEAGELVAVGQHILKWVANDQGAGIITDSM